MSKNVCFSCLKETRDGFCYSCRKELFDGRKVRNVLPFTLPEFEERKLHDCDRLSISGYQLKHSVRLEKNKIVLTEMAGQYILKPEPNSTFLHTNQLPANEHVTMQIARQVFGIRTAPNAFMYFADGQPAYLTRRFDIDAAGNRVAVEDFAQLAQMTIETDGSDYKYKYSYEGIGRLIQKYVSASAIVLEEFFRLVVFNYLISNGDAHLKNFSICRNNEYGDYLFTPAYDLVCTRLHLPNESDMALDLFESEGYQAGSKHVREDFLEFGRRLEIPNGLVNKIIDDYQNKLAGIMALVERSFLSDVMKDAYLKLYVEKIARMKR